MSILRILWSPVTLVMTLLGALKLGSGEDIVSLFRKPNDTAAHLARGKWMQRYGAMGICPESYMGNPVAQFYPPVFPYLIATLGPALVYVLSVLTFSVGVAVFVYGIWVMAGIPVQWHALGALVYVIAGRVPVTITLKFGRPEMLAWGVAFFGLGLFGLGHPVPAGVALAGVMYIHPAAGFFSIVTLIALAGLKAFYSSDFIPLMQCILTSLAAGSIWWVPFYMQQGEIDFAKIWDSGLFGKPWRTYLAPVGCYLVFSAGILAPDFFHFSRGENTGVPMQLAAAKTGILLIPALIYLAGIMRGSYRLHYGSIFFFALAIGLMAATLSHSPKQVMGGFILLALFANCIGEIHPPAIEPVEARGNCRRVMGLMGLMPPMSRAALECQPENFTTDSLRWSWIFSLAFEGSGREILSGVGFDQVNPKLVLDIERKINAKTPMEKLNRLLDTAGAKYVFAYSREFAEKLESMKFERRGAVKLDAMGDLSARSYVLYESPEEIYVVTPQPDSADDIRPPRWNAGSIEMHVTGGVTYRIRYWPYPGWTAVQGGSELKLNFLSNPDSGKVGLEFKANRSGTVQISYHPLFGLRKKGGSSK